MERGISIYVEWNLDGSIFKGETMVSGIAKMLDFRLWIYRYKKNISKTAKILPLLFLAHRRGEVVDCKT